MDIHAKSTDEYKIRSTDRLDEVGLKTDETLFSLANGRLGVRGNFAEGTGRPDASPFYMNGLYNHYPFRYEENYKQFPQRGQTIFPLPDASMIEIHTADGPLDKRHADLIFVDRTLDMWDGGTIRTATYRTKDNHAITVTEERRLAVGQNVFLQRITVHSVDYSGGLVFRSHLKMPTIPEAGVEDPRLSRPIAHLRMDSCHHKDDIGWILATTTESNYAVCAGIAHDVGFAYETVEKGILGTLLASLSPDQSFSFTKYSAFASTNVETDPVETVRSLLSQRFPFGIYAHEEKRKNEQFWKTSDVELGTPELTKAIRYNLYQLNRSGGEDAFHSIAAKGISGDGYEGHYFWDTETYMLPFFLLTNPIKARNLLEFRIRHLPQARLEASNLGVSRGAKIPWRTIDGSETSPYYPAGSAQIHINSDIALAAIQYFYATMDEAFLDEGGAELILETAIFLFDWGHFKDGRFHLDTVTGPDEYSALVNDNHYTNKMAQRHFLEGSRLLNDRRERMDSLVRRLGYDWDDIHALTLAGEQMALPFDGEHNLWLQDEHFNAKKELPLETLPNEAFPLLLSHHPLFIYRHQVLKQADTVLAMVLSNDPVDERYANTVEYYRKRTTHDSSLSKCAYGIALCRLNDQTKAMEYFRDVLFLDLYDLKRHTRHGLHLANMGGSYLMVALGIFGIRFGKELSIDPKRIEGWKKASIRFQYHGVSIELRMDSSGFKVTSSGPLPMWIQGRKVIVDSPHPYEVKTLTK